MSVTDVGALVRQYIETVGIHDLEPHPPGRIVTVRRLARLLGQADPLAHGALSHLERRGLAIVDQ